MRVRRLLLLALLGALLFSARGPALAEDGRSFPEALLFVQETQINRLSNNRLKILCYPHTALPEVDAEIAGIIDAQAARAEAYLPGKGVSPSLMSRLDAGSYISRVGTRWMSFLTIARVSHNRRQLWVAFDTRVYDMETGERVTLDRVIDGDKGGWDFLSREAARQLAAHFPEEAADPLRLEALTGPEAIREAPFTLHPGHLTLHFAVDDLYDGHDPALLRVEIYYSALRPWMTEEALAETDCSGYTLVAFTYDDGPAAGATDHVLNALREYGAEATFFTVGFRVVQNPDLIHREYDAGFSVQSHSYYHRYNPAVEDILPWRDLMAREMEAVTGVAPTLFRAPGGVEYRYVEAGQGLPMIRWSLSSNDAMKEYGGNPTKVLQRVRFYHDGDIVLFHDLNSRAGDIALYCLSSLSAKSVMFVTVEDLCELRGVRLRPDVSIDACPPAGADPAPGEDPAEDADAEAERLPETDPEDVPDPQTEAAPGADAEDSAEPEPDGTPEETPDSGPRPAPKPKKDTCPLIEGAGAFCLIRGLHIGPAGLSCPLRRSRSIPAKIRRSSRAPGFSTR